jgi:hypothetical protein
MILMFGLTTWLFGFGELTSFIDELIDVGTLLFIVNWPIKQMDWIIWIVKHLLCDI